MRKRPLVLAALMVMLFDWILISFGVIRMNGNEYEEKSNLIITGELYSKQLKDDKCILYLKKARSDNEKIGRVILYEYFSDENTHKGSYDIPLGSRLKVRITVLPMHRAENEGSFDEEAYLTSRNIKLKASVDDITVLSTPVFSFTDALFNLREKMMEVYSVSLPGEEAGILSTMTLGDKSIMSKEAGELFSDAGLSHIFAISSMHISIVGMGVLSILSKIFSRNKAGIISCVFVVCYTVMVGASVSAIRAVGMFVIMIAAQLLCECYDSLSAMALTAIIILLISPVSLYDVSFIFSYGVVCVLICFANPLADYYTRVCKYKWEKTHRKDKGRRFRIRMSQRIKRELIRGLALQIASLPLVSYYFYKIPVYVIFLNLFLLPLLGLVLGCGLVGGLVGCVWLSAGGLILIPCHFLIYLYEMAADMSLKLPFSIWVCGRPAMWKIAVYYAVITALAYWIYILRIRLCEKEVLQGKKAVLSIAFSFVLLCVFLSIRQRHFEVDMLSVGQGDGIFIDSGMGEYFFIDGGSSSNDAVGKYVIKPFLYSRGISHIDGWFISHMDLDHISGFKEIIEEGFKVERLYLAKGIERDERLDEVLALCKECEIEVVYMVPGDALSCKGWGLSEKQIIFKCIAPDYPSSFTGANENSLVLHLIYSKNNEEAFDGIFTGDIGEEQERAVLESVYGSGLCSLGADGKIELLKSAHHGSNYSNCSEWLSALSPQLCIISAGKNNLYHHPGAEALARMEEAGISHLCTIDTGQISIRWKDGEMVVEEYRR